MKNPKLQYYVKLCLALLMWAGMYHVVKPAAELGDPVLIAFIRYFISAGLLLVVLRVKTKQWIPKLALQQWLLIFCIGVIGICVYNILFFNVKSLLPQKKSDNISVEQISFLLKDNVLLSFQEKRSDFFTHIRERIRTNSGVVRTKKADYLLYLLLDAIIENFYITIESEENKVDDLIDLSKKNTNPEVLELIEKHRDNFNFLKRSIIPLRDSLYSIKSIKDDNVFNDIQHENFTFFSRLHQKCLELLEQIDSDLITLESASNYFFSAQNHKMNQVMKTLTVVSMFFLPFVQMLQ